MSVNSANNSDRAVDTEPEGWRRKNDTLKTLYVSAALRSSKFHVIHLGRYTLRLYCGLIMIPEQAWKGRKAKARSKNASHFLAKLRVKTKD